MFSHFQEGINNPWKMCFHISFKLFGIAYSFYVDLFLQLVKLAKKLKQEKVNIDTVNFGEDERVILYLHIFDDLQLYCSALTE